MKKILLIFIVFLMSGICYSQNIIQYISCNMDNKVNCGYDTIESKNIEPQKVISIDSVQCNDEYKNFFNDVLLGYCSGVKYFVMQISLKQSMSEERIVLNDKNGNIVIINYAELSADDKLLYTNFVNKVKTKIL